LIIKPVTIIWEDSYTRDGYNDVDDLPPHTVLVTSGNLLKHDKKSYYICRDSQEHGSNRDMYVIQKCLVKKVIRHDKIEIVSKEK